MNQLTSEPNGKRVFDELAVMTRVVTVLAGLTGLMFLRVVMGGGLISSFAEEMAVWLPLTIGLLMVGLIGAIVSWRWHSVGGLMLVGAGFGLGAAFYWLQESWGTAVFYGSPYLIAGSLCLTCGYRKHKNQQTA